MLSVLVCVVPIRKDPAKPAQIRPETSEQLQHSTKIAATSIKKSPVPLKEQGNLHNATVITLAQN
jgi:hypothetical protein